MTRTPSTDASPPHHGLYAMGSPVRYVSAALAITAGLTHLVEAEDQFHRATWFGLCFLAVTAAWIVVGAYLAVVDDMRVWRAALLVALTSALLGSLGLALDLPRVTDDVGRWSDLLAAVRIGLAGLVLPAAAWTLGRWPARGRQAPLRSSRSVVVAGVATMLVGLSFTGSAAVGEARESAGTAGMRTYYVGADEVRWNYAPTGQNGITGKAFDATAQTYTKQTATHIGASYLKCLYRGYTDGSFSKLTQRPAQDAYLGLLGPVIRAEVGDTIKVVFRNGCRIGASVHPHGVFYQKSSEGAPYADNTSGLDKQDDAVPQGGRHTYTWLVPDRAGPGPHDGSSVMWMYHSHTDEVSDTYAGLMGPMEITAKGMARADGSPSDVDREVFELFSVLNENNSPYLAANVQHYTSLPKPPAEDEDFEESNLKHSINGYVFGNQPMLTLTKGEHVRWYVMDMGTEVDLHTPHWHGNDVVVAGMRMDVVSLLPASMAVADMVPDNPGIWLFHCHVNDHITAGMITRYQVLS